MQIVTGLRQSTGLEALYRRGKAGHFGLGGTKPSTPMPKPTAVLRADASWDQFFDRARSQPQEEGAKLLADLRSRTSGNEELGKKMAIGLPAKAVEDVPASAFWGDEEVVFSKVPLIDEDGIDVDAASFTQQTSDSSSSLKSSQQALPSIQEETREDFEDSRSIVALGSVVLL